ncbi:hypothetical protein [Chlorogloeopsis sp. ULAP02]
MLSYQRDRYSRLSFVVFEKNPLVSTKAEQRKKLLILLLAIATMLVGR